MNQSVVHLISLFAVLLSSFGVAQNASGGFAADTTIRMFADFSGTGSVDSVLVRITGDKLGNPLVWSVSVREHRGDLVYYSTACVCAADGFFESEEYIVQRVYRGTMRDWYYVDLPERVLMNRKFSPQSAMFDRSREDSFYRRFYEYLVGRFRVPAADAETLTESIALRLMKNDVTLLTVPKNPADPGEAMIYVKEIRQFVPIGPW